jgi:hypothetical protein
MLMRIIRAVARTVEPAKPRAGRAKSRREDPGAGIIAIS